MKNSDKQILDLIAQGFSLKNLLKRVGLKALLIAWIIVSYKEKDMKEIQLTRGYVALVDDEDYEYVNQWKWFAHDFAGGLIYADRNNQIKRKQHHVKMHRVILGIVDPKLYVDHKDRNGLNNQKSNLRICTHSQNMANRRSRVNSTSKYLGVHRCRQYNKWRAEIGKDKKITFLGRFDEEIEAALAYNKKAIELHGEFANLNIINETNR